MAEMLKVQLSEQTHVEIVKREWPTIAESRHKGNVARWWLKVRVHADGSVLIYGQAVTVISKTPRSAGELIEHKADLISTIKRVGKALGAPAFVAAACAFESTCWLRNLRG